MIRNDTNLGFAKAVNQGIKKSTGEYILLLNTDAFVTQGQLTALVSTLESDKQFGIIAPKLLNQDGSIQSSYGNFPSLTSIFFHALSLERLFLKGLIIYQRKTSPPPSPKKRGGNGEVIFPDWVSGACMLIKRSVIDRVGFFDEHYFMGIEDIDFCYRVQQAGFRVVYDREQHILHYHQYTSKKLKTRSIIVQSEIEGLSYFYKKFYPTHRLRLALVRLLLTVKNILRRIRLFV